MSNVNERIAAYRDKVLEHRRWLHQHPELSGQEKESAAYIAAALRGMGLDPIEGVGGYGVVALIEGTAPGKCIGLRADFDALPIQETTGLPFASNTPGVMHACGHDAHAAMLLGAAYVLHELRDSFRGCVKLVFQPSEENNMASGAKAMIADGVLENPKVDAMIGQHMWPQLETGRVSLRSGAMTAASDRFYIDIYGRKSHGSAPENGIDAIVVAAQVVNMLQTVVSRNVGPLDSTVITVGEIHGGVRYNVIPDHVRMVGTCRNLNPALRDEVSGHIEDIVRGVTGCMGADYRYEYIRGYSPTVNDDKLFRMVADIAAEKLGRENLEIPEHSQLGGEDFSFFSEKVPSCFYWLGSHAEGTEFYPLHHGSFIADEDALPTGITVMVESALKFLAE